MLVMLLNTRQREEIKNMVNKNVFLMRKIFMYLIINCIFPQYKNCQLIWLMLGFFVQWNVVELEMIIFMKIHEKFI